MEIIDRRPDFVEQHGIAKVIYTFPQHLNSDIFSYLHLSRIPILPLL